MLQNAIEIDVTGADVFGVTQQQGSGSQLQAGARAQFIDSPITRALSTLRGRVAAQTVEFMFRGQVTPLINYAVLRPFAMQYAIKQALRQSASGKHVVDPAGGYSPVFYWLAETFPATTFTELDTVATITQKQNALASFDMPDNLHLQVADLTQTPIHTVLSAKPDVILALGAYVSHTAYRQLLHYLSNTLNQGAMVVGAFPFLPGIENFRQNSTIFSKIVAEPLGVVSSIQTLEGIFADTPFELCDVYRLTDLARMLDKPLPA
ncbi:MAG: hypothetical protein AAFR67_13095, partial [Chloroflexota bacterium]